MIRIAIVEDETIYQESLQKNITQFFSEHSQQNYLLKIFSDGSEIMEAYEKGACHWDLIFLDILMKNKDGVQTAHEIRAMDSRVVLIFVTTMAQYVMKGYEVDALDFVVKPVTYAQLCLKLQKALNRIQKQETRSLLLTDKSNVFRVDSGDIYYIEVKNHSLYVVTAKGTVIIRESMKEIEKKLEGLAFARCSNAYLVNLEQVKEILHDSVKLSTTELPMTRTRKKEFLERFSDFYGEQY